MCFSHFPLPAIIQWTQVACIFEINCFPSGYSSLFYLRIFQSRIWKYRLSSCRDQERLYKGNTGTKVDLTGVCVCTECWKFYVKQLTIYRYVKLGSGVLVSLICSISNGIISYFFYIQWLHSYSLCLIMYLSKLANKFSIYVARRDQGMLCTVQ